MQSEFYLGKELCVPNTRVTEDDGRKLTLLLGENEAETDHMFVGAKCNVLYVV